MKKLYYLDEEEKNRILNLHESRTKNQYLNEQSYGGVSQAAINAILAVSKKNKQGLSGSMLAPLQQREIDAKFGAGTFDKFFKNGGEALLMGKEYKPQNIFKSVNSLLFNWGQYPCVSSNRSAKKVYLEDSTIAYRLNGEVYYDNGRKKGVDGEMSSYYCDGMNIKEGNKPTTGTTTTGTTTTGTTTTSGAPVSGIGLVLISPQQVTALRTNAGLTGTGNSLSQQDINDLYNMINKLPNPNK